MRGSRIPSGKRIINNVPPLNPSDLSEANALNLMFLWDNEGSGEYLEDSSILGRHLAQIQAREQASPNMTLEVLPGLVWFATNTYVNFAGGNSPLIVAPISNPRIDILTIRNDGTLHVITGTEAGSPTPPTIPSTDIPIAQIFNVVGETVIHDNDAQIAGQGYIQYDLRPFVQVAVGASAMPKIGIVARIQSALTGNTIQNVVNFSGAGRMRLAHIKVTAVTTNVQIIIIADGVTLLSIGYAATGDFDAHINKSDQTTVLQSVAGTDNPGQILNIFFKSSLQITYQGSNVGDAATVTVEYEHE